jgi:hypothetical protein
MKAVHIIAPLAAVAALGACSGSSNEAAPANESTAASANEAFGAGPATPTADGPLAVYVGKQPFEPVAGTAFLDHERVKAAVEVAVRTDDPRLWVFRRDATRRPIVMKDGRLLSVGCETGNCAGRNWTIKIDTLGAIAEVCWHEGGRTRIFSGGRAGVASEGGCPTE